MKARKHFYHRAQSLITLFVLCIGLFMQSCGPELPTEIEEAYATLPEVIDFNFHVRPILSDRCFACHGPDENTRKANLRLDLEENAFAQTETGGRPFVRGDFAKSHAIDRILSNDPSFMMPPPEAKMDLSAKEIATIIKWVEQGAEWEPHWSYIPPIKSELPNEFPAEWKPENEIDYFIYQKLHQENIQPSARAEKEQLIRRVTLDLTGLPPTLEEIDNFLADNSELAYEKVVDRLLKSDAHAERLAMEWMDLSRYADSHGLHADGYRYMWPWRDWVIQAFKNNMSYDSFVTWQLAGDLLPNSTKEQMLATAFNRNHPMTAEGGVIDEEFRLEYVADRTNTVSTAFLGLTMECARCHDHKFDPISQKEYYELSAFFNNIKELGMTGDDGNYGPNLMMTTPIQEAEISELRKMISGLQDDLNDQQKDSHQSSLSELPEKNDISGLQLYCGFERFSPTGTDSSYFFEGKETITTSKKPRVTDGKLGKSVHLTGEYDDIQIKGVGIFDAYDPFSGGAWVNTSKRNPQKTQTIFGNSGNKNNYWRGWDLVLDSLNRVSVRLIHSLPHNYIQIKTVDSIRINTWNHIFFTYDGSMEAKGIKIFINGKEVESFTEYDNLYKSILPVKVFDHQTDARPLQLGKSNRAFTGENGLFKGNIDEVRIYNKELTPLEVFIVSDASGPPSQEIIASHQLLITPDVKNTKAEIRKAKKNYINYVADIPEVMVMREMETPRPTHKLLRGQYDAKGEQVFPSTPESVLSFPEDLSRNRLGLAHWLFMYDNPLTARVTVNRYWQMIFGRGIVSTTNDFGSQGALPTHPELLDWLAVTFKESGWDVRALLKTMVLSATYRQSSKYREGLKEKDPENLLLAKSPSYRWQAEIIRDNALAVSGLLHTKVGGESVKPYQPDSLWIELGNFSHVLLYYQQDQGNDLYRRSLYTFIRRTAPPPFMTNFDVASRNVCTVQRETTNTPLQALNLLNDPQFVEAARVLAERTLKSAEETPAAQIDHAFRLVTSRYPDAEESGILLDLYDREMKKYAVNPEEADKLLEVGEYEIDGDLPKPQLAALTMVANTMLNFDETYTKR